VRLVWHRIFIPRADAHIDFEHHVEETLLSLRERFQVRAVRYDPYMMQASAQRLRRAGVPMQEYPQSVPNITEASQNLYELIKARSLTVYPDSDIRLCVQRAVAVESARGWKISKEKASHKIDIVVALGMAALATIHEVTRPRPAVSVCGPSVYQEGAGWTHYGPKLPEPKPEPKLEPAPGPVSRCADPSPARRVFSAPTVIEG
jgi:hypothetical protein